MDNMKRLSQLADELFAEEAKVAELQADLKAAQKRVQKLAEFDIPELMDDLGVTELKTTSGLRVEVAEKLHAKKLTEAHVQALEWLRQHNQGGLIKTLVGVPFSAGSESDADQLVDRLAGEGIAAQKSVEVHHSSLAAALRTMLEQGEEIPDYMGAYQRRVAAVKPTKK